MKEYFDPKTNKFPYPQYTDQHYLEVKKNDGTVFDDKYPYIDNSKSHKFKAFLLRIVLLILVFPITYIRLGLKVEGKKNLKKYKDVISKGVLSCCNHVHMWDYLGILTGIKPNKPHVLIWAPNIRGENGKAMRLVGGIPIPEDNLKATGEYMRQVGNYLNNGGWLHIYPEGSMWEYYAPIRPLKRGVAYFACKYDKPVIPLAYSYRKPGFIRRKIFKQIALFTLNIGEPIYMDKSIVGRKEQELDLTRRMHEVMCKLAYIDPKDNIYPFIFDNSERIDYYTSTYGVGYKGSH